MELFYYLSVVRRIGGDETIYDRSLQSPAIAVSHVKIYDTELKWNGLSLYEEVDEVCNKKGKKKDLGANRLA